MLTIDQWPTEWSNKVILSHNDKKVPDGLGAQFADRIVTLF